METILFISLNSRAKKHCFGDEQIRTENYLSIHTCNYYISNAKRFHEVISVSQPIHLNWSFISTSSELILTEIMIFAFDGERKKTVACTQNHFDMLASFQHQWMFDSPWCETFFRPNHLFVYLLWPENNASEYDSRIQQNKCLDYSVMYCDVCCLWKFIWSSFERKDLRRHICFYDAIAKFFFESHFMLFAFCSECQAIFGQVISMSPNK